MLSKTKKLKLLAKLNPEKEANFLMQALEQDIKEIESKIVAVKDYSHPINDIKNQIGLLRILQDSILEKFSDLPNKDVFEEVKKNYLENIAALEQKLISIIINKVSVLTEELETVKVNTEIDFDLLKDKLEKLRITLLSHGGGSMNQKISINGTVISTRYADINLKGSGITYTAANNDTTKQVDLTLTSSGAASFNYETPLTGTLGVSSVYTFSHSIGQLVLNNQVQDPNLDYSGQGTTTANFLNGFIPTGTSLLNIYIA